jgi:hypothetical protein
MPIVNFSFNGTEVKVVAALQARQGRMVALLTEKMTYLMVKLQEKIQSKTKGIVSESIRNPRAVNQSGVITGYLDWGGEPTTVTYKTGKPYDIAQILNEGAKAHAINPLTVEGTRLHEKGAVRRFGSNVLHFESARLGKEVFAAYVFHPGVAGQHFIESSIEEMRVTFAQEIAATLQQVKSEIRPF